MNMNLASFNNGFSRSHGKIYGQVSVDEDFEYQHQQALGVIIGVVIAVAAVCSVAVALLWWRQHRGRGLKTGGTPLAGTEKSVTINMKSHLLLKLMVVVVRRLPCNSLLMPTVVPSNECPPYEILHPQIVPLKHPTPTPVVNHAYTTIENTSSCYSESYERRVSGDAGVSQGEYAVPTTASSLLLLQQQHVSGDASNTNSSGNATTVTNLESNTTSTGPTSLVSDYRAMVAAAAAEAAAADIGAYCSTTSGVTPSKRVPSWTPGCSSRRQFSMDSSRLARVDRKNLHFVRKLGMDDYGEVSLCLLDCHADEPGRSSSKQMVAVKSLSAGATEILRKCTLVWTVSRKHCAESTTSGVTPSKRVPSWTPGCSSRRQFSMDSSRLARVDRKNLHFVRKLGMDDYGEVSLCLLDCHADEPGRSSSKQMVAVKSLSAGATEILRNQINFESHINVGLLIPAPPPPSVPPPPAVEAYDTYDIHTGKRETVVDSPNINNNLLMSGSPAAKPMQVGFVSRIPKHKIHFVRKLGDGDFGEVSLCVLEDHPDEAGRVVGKQMVAVKSLNGGATELLSSEITDLAVCQPEFSSHYYRTEGGPLLPVRWMAWESIMAGRWSVKSDVWSFGVTLWEILTLAKSLPYGSFTNELVIDNLMHIQRTGESKSMLAVPPHCPKELYDLMRECWLKNEAERPQFKEIHMFLQRKNLGYKPAQC
ncbi:unnamed protein product [Notodromas monacha]|uniref:Protein kinase domain-containing protein n=1 Tax=Notodromas monacha TaxID=399045 RepID=A0A7R9GHH3_9CRUS|nr:unnamed protein product [Notodromas monacha]CAG0921466.1 unnamed protein product [Notodromas monacha]